jgi:hypothetical protein
MSFVLVIDDQGNKPKSRANTQVLVGTELEVSLIGGEVSAEGRKSWGSAVLARA